MIRKLAVLATGVLALSGIAVAGAGASTAPPTGTLTCGVTGTATFKPTLTPATPKNTSYKIHKASLGPCDNTLVTGGKFAITGGDLTLNAKLTGADSATVAAGTDTLKNPQLIVKLTGQNTQGKTATVAVIRPVNVSIVPSGIGFAITGDIPQNKAQNKPFGGEHFSSQFNVDNIADFVGCLNGQNDVSHIDFSSAGGSQVTIS